MKAGYQFRLSFGQVERRPIVLGDTGDNENDEAEWLVEKIRQRAVDSLCDGARIRLGAGPANADNFQWWQVAGRTGWVVSDYLRYPDAAQ